VSAPTSDHGSNLITDRYNFRSPESFIGWTKLAGMFFAQMQKSI